MWTKTLTKLLATFFLVVVLFSCGSKEQKEEKEEASMPIQPVKPKEVVAIGRIEPKEKIVTVYPEASGILKKLNIELGDTVQKGQIIAELEHRQESANVQLSRAQLNSQQSTINSIRADLAKAQANVAYTSDQNRRYQEAYQSQAATQQEAENAKNALEVAEAEEKRQEALLANAEARLEEYRAQVAVSQAQLEKKIIRAATEGVVLTVDVSDGALVSPSASIGQIAPVTKLIAVCEVDELYAARVKEGQPAIIRNQGELDTLAQGTVYETAPSLRQKSLFSDEVGKLEDRRVREVKIVLTRGEQNVLIGMRVECVIKLD